MRVPAHARPAVAAGLTWCAVGRLAGAQLPGVAVDPHIVVLSPAQPTSEVTVFNPRTTRAEYDVSLRYGYAGTDSSGQAAVHLDSTAARGAPATGVGASAAPWVTPYPRRFVLEPGAWQTVRFAARPPAALPDGEYWARVTLRARELAPPTRLAASGAAIAGISAVLQIETTTVLPLFYRAGPVRTGVVVDSLWGVCDANTILLGATLRRTGNAAFLGVASLTVHDSSGAALRRLERPIAVYGNATPRWRIERPPTATGCGVGWRAALTLRAERHDVASRLILPSDSVRGVVAIGAH